MFNNSNNDLSKLNKYCQSLIDESTKNTQNNLDFLEGFVYALLIVQEKIKETARE
jgi:hypothetical protein